MTWVVQTIITYESITNALDDDFGQHIQSALILQIFHFNWFPVEREFFCHNSRSNEKLKMKNSFKSKRSWTNSIPFAIVAANIKLLKRFFYVTDDRVLSDLHLRQRQNETERDYKIQIILHQFLLPHFTPKRNPQVKTIKWNISISKWWWWDMKCTSPTSIRLFLIVFIVSSADNARQQTIENYKKQKEKWKIDSNINRNRSLVSSFA